MSPPPNRSFETYLQLNLAAARVWSHAGAHGIAITGRHQGRLDKIATELRLLNQDALVLAIQVDVTREINMDDLAQVLKTFGRSTDVVIASSGGVVHPPARMGDQVQTAGRVLL